MELKDYEKSIYKLIYGHTPSYNKTMIIEECSELIKAITKDIRGNNNARENIVEEIVDVTIMIDIAKVMYGIDEKEFISALLDKMDKNVKRCTENSKGV